MKTKCFAIYDVKTKAYMHPFMALTHGEAIRSLDDAVNSGKGMIANHPEDFKLFELAEFDDITGDYVNRDANLPIISAQEMVNDKNLPIIESINKPAEKRLDN